MLNRVFRLRLARATTGDTAVPYDRAVSCLATSKLRLSGRASTTERLPHAFRGPLPESAK